jgi:hypothetical protein
MSASDAEPWLFAAKEHKQKTDKRKLFKPNVKLMLTNI